MATPLKDRSPSMDIVRLCALFLVVSVHYFYHNSFYSTPVEGVQMYFMVLIRTFCMTCVPLFMTLSGYLSCKKQPSMSYYSKIIYIIVIYMMASACCVLYKNWFTKESLTLMDYINGLFLYKSAPYGWYVEMYFGLFLMCPFLNVMYNGLKTKNHKELLVITFLLLTSIPKVVNIFIPDIQWFMDPTSSNEYIKLLPSFWYSIYPITYYFIGCYLREYKLKIKPWIQGVLCVLSFVLIGSFNVYRSYGAKLVQGQWTTYSSLFTVVQVVLLFSFIDSLNYSKFPKFLSKILAKMSAACFGGYLVSWIFDQIAYNKILKPAVPVVMERFKFSFVAVPLIFICSILLSMGLNYIYDFGNWAVKKLLPKKKEQTADSNT